jgi:hypothetical protein
LDYDYVLHIVNFAILYIYYVTSRLRIFHLCGNVTKFRFMLGAQGL